MADSLWKPRPAGNPASEPTSDEEATAEVARLLRDLRLLARFVATCRPRVLALPNQGIGSDRAPIGPAAHIELVARTPAEIASDPNLLEQLYSGLTTLSEAVAPASAGSIRLTSAFVGRALEPQPPAEVQALARAMMRWFVALAVLGFAAFIVTVILLIYTDDGRQTLRQLEATKTQYQQLRASLADVDAAGAKLAGATVCSADWINSVGARQQELCARLAMLKHRQLEIGQELSEWNAAGALLSTPIRWLIGGRTARHPLSDEDWQAAEVQAAAIMSDLTGIVLPMLLGLLGASAYVFRSLGRQTRAWTLHRGAATHATLHLLLGITLGGLLSVFWTSGTEPRIDGITLSLAAVAFFVGFGVEVVFQTLDTMIAGVANKIANAKSQ